MIFLFVQQGYRWKLPLACRRRRSIPPFSLRPPDETLHEASLVPQWWGPFPPPPPPSPSPDSIRDVVSGVACCSEVSSRSISCNEINRSDYVRWMRTSSRAEEGNAVIRHLGSFTRKETASRPLSTLLLSLNSILHLIFDLLFCGNDKILIWYDQHWSICERRMMHSRKKKNSPLFWFLFSFLFLLPMKMFVI